MRASAIVMTVWLAAGLGWGVSPSFAQTPPADFLEFRAAWARAVQRADGPAAANLAALPLQYAGYGAPRTIDRARFIREVGGWSTLSRCLADEPPETVKGRSRLGTLTFNCNGHGFYFARRDGKWLHTGYENTNE